MIFKRSSQHYKQARRLGRNLSSVATLAINHDGRFLASGGGLIVTVWRVGAKYPLTIDVLLFALVNPVGDHERRQRSRDMGHSNRCTDSTAFLWGYRCSRIDYVRAICRPKRPLGLDLWDFYGQIGDSGTGK